MKGYPSQKTNVKEWKWIKRTKKWRSKGNKKQTVNRPTKTKRVLE